MNGLLLDINLVNPIHHEKSFIYPGSFGPGRSNLTLMQFSDIKGWRDYLLTLQINDTRVPGIHSNAYHDALKALLLAWVEPATIKPVELQALRSLEGALRGVYFQPMFEKMLAQAPKSKLAKFRPGLGQFLEFMREHDDLPDALHSKSGRGPGSALDTIRNRLAHGDPFNNLPWGGLLESVRDVVIYAYRNHPASGMSPSQTGGTQSLC
jgi:hypothetical protein